MPTLVVAIWLKMWYYNCVFTALSLSQVAKFWAFIQLKCYLHVVRIAFHCFPHVWDHSDSRCMPLIKVIILKRSNTAGLGYITLYSTKFTRPKNKLLLNLSRDGVNNISSYFPYILLHLSRTQTRSRVKTFSYKWISIGLVFTKENAFFICAVHKICKNKCGGMKETSQEIQPFCARTI